MADYEVPHRHVGAYNKTLVAATVDRVFFRGNVAGNATPGWGNPIEQIEVSTSDTDIFVTIGETPAPTVGGTVTWRVPAEPGSRVLNVPRSAFSANGDLQVNLISSGTPTYSVSRVG